MLTLHAHSNYSLLEGAVRIDSLIDFAKKSGSGYVSLTDTNGMYGLIQFAAKAEAEKIKPILGAMIDDPDDTGQRAVMLAKNNIGYSKLCKIITTRKLKDDFSLAALINDGVEDLFVLTLSLIHI